MLEFIYIINIYTNIYTKTIIGTILGELISRAPMLPGSDSVMQLDLIMQYLGMYIY